MKRLFLSLFCLSLTLPLLAQEYKTSGEPHPIDTIQVHDIAEVVLIGNSTTPHLKENKALGSVDSYLEKAPAVNMVKRGAYAWEPMLNGMSTERSVLTIDGMRIFHACTDKMDPITSYVENTNLSKATIAEGQSGAEMGGTIAGGIDLVRRKSGFKPEPKWGGSAFAGFESNNKQQIYGATLSYSGPRFFTDVDFTHRHADNYKAGHRSGQRSEVLYSQFTKNNLSAIAGFKINEHQELEASLIYDRATDVGYPGLPMDVALAKATIGSLEYRYKDLSPHLDLWETKLYYNTITHIMDDTHRPDVHMHMDMPGWSKTGGFYSRINGSTGKHDFRATVSGYLNNSLAEMTMYPHDPNEKEMYMLTWPDVNTLYSGVNLEDELSLNPHLSLLLTGGLGVHHNEIKSELGLSSLQLFYPQLKSGKTRFLKNLSSQLSFHHHRMMYRLGVGYGERAPSVSEAYGFYLLNVNDNYDYVGNPDLKNEKSLNVELSTSYSQDKFEAKAKVNYFYILDYIIGKPRPGIPPMNMTASGIKVYESLSHASLLNTSLQMSYRPVEEWQFTAEASYRYGQGAGNTILPLIQPFNYKLMAKYDLKSFFAELCLEGSSKNRNSEEFGETQKPAYEIVNFTLSKNFKFGGQNITAKAGVENLFDRYYSTFDDWFGIPRMGRNIFVNVIYRF